MFRIVCDPSSGSIELYLTEIIRSGSQMFVVCLVGVWQRNFEPVVCVFTVRYRTHTPLVQNYAPGIRNVVLILDWLWKIVNNMLIETDRLSMLLDKGENKVTSFKLTKYDFAAACLNANYCCFYGRDANMNNSRERKRI